MAIKNKFIHFKTRAAFDVNVPNPTSTADDGNQFYNYTTFIQDTKEIYTHGTFYKCNISEEEVEALIASKGYITEDDIPVLSGGAAATSGQYVSGVTVSGHNVTVTKAALPTSVSGNAGTATKLATSRVIAIAGAVQGSATFDGSSNVSINSTLNGFDASKITSGTINADRLPEIPISKIPAAAMERLYVVESQSAAMSLTIQEGDVVQIGSGGPMYFCVSESASTFATKFKVFTAGAATSVPWSGVTNAPTKLSQFTNDSGFTTNKGTVTSVAMSVPTGLSVSGSPITASGTLALSYTSGYSIPTTAKQTNWDTAYGWGNHASAGYVKNSVDENITGIKNFMNGFKVFTNSATTSNEYNTTGKINHTDYAAPIIFGTNSGKVWWSTQFQSSTILLIGRANSIPIRIQSLNSIEGNASEIYATRFYQNEKLVATEEWVTGKGYLTSVPAQTWGSITGKPTFATVATSGSYNDLTNKPTIPSLDGYATESWVGTQNFITMPEDLAEDRIVIGAGTNSVTSKRLKTINGVSLLVDDIHNVTNYNVNRMFPWNAFTGSGNITGLHNYLFNGVGQLISIEYNNSAYTNLPVDGESFVGTLQPYKYTADNNWSVRAFLTSENTGKTYTGVFNMGQSALINWIEIGKDITSSEIVSALGFTPISSNKIPVALPNPHALTINGTSYTGSSAVSVTTPKILSTTTLRSSTVSAGYSYNNTASRTISSLSGFSASNPDSVIISTARLAFTASNAIKMDGLADLAGTYYIYCLSYMANGKIAVNGAAYA